MRITRQVTSTPGILEAMLKDAWHSLLTVLSAYAQGRVAPAANCAGHSKDAGMRLPDAVRHCLRPIQALQQFLSAEQRLSESQLAVLPRVCRQIVVSLDEDLQLQLLTCCYRFLHAQCPPAVDCFRLLQEQAQAEALLLMCDKSEESAGGAGAGGAGQSTAIRTLAMLGTAHPYHVAGSEQALIDGLQLMRSNIQVLRPVLHHSLLQLWKGIRHSRWQPECLRDLGLLTQCRRLHALARLCESTTLERGIRALEQALISLHLHQREPAQRVQECLLAAVLRWQYAVHTLQIPAKDEARNVDSNDDLLPGATVMDGNGIGFADTTLVELQLCQAELAQLLIARQDECVTTLPRVSLELLGQAYATSAALMLLPANGWQDLYRALYLFLAQHWYQQLPLGLDNIRLIIGILKHPIVADLAAAKCSLDQNPARPGLHELLYDLLLAWPAASIAPDLEITLTSYTGTAHANVPLDAMPVVLASGLDALARIRADMFCSPEHFRQHQPALQAALMLLEQGAAAVRVKAVEKLSQGLLDVYLVLDWLPAVDFPGPLLWQAHQQLLVALDNAAAWGEPVPDEQLLIDLAVCQQASRTGLASAELAEPDAGDWRQVRQQLLGYVQALTAVLDIQVRLHIQGLDDTCSARMLSSLQQGLVPLLRFQVLDFSLAVEARRVRHQPQSGNIWLELQKEPALVRVVLHDDSGRAAPDVLQWQQLLHRLKRAGLGEATCTCGMLGRRFECVIPAPDDGLQGPQTTGQQQHQKKSSD